MTTINKEARNGEAMTGINKVAIIGSGVMGSGIAAQLTNAGLPVVLLDIKVEGKDLAAEAVAKMLKTEPAAFMRKSNAKLITTGTIDDDIDLLGDCDWIIEVVVEKLEIKHATYEKIEAARKKPSIVSSNTSTIPLYKLVEGQPDSFAKDFMITHFFNPPRYMRLMELIVGEKTDPKSVEIIREICDVKLGKGVVQCHDTPGFIANRLGVFWLTAGVNEAIKQSVPIELADAVMSKPVGIPKTGIFGLIDLVGIDLMPKLSESLLSSLPENDTYRDVFIDHKFVHDMIEAGYTGRKGKGGFYRLNPDAPKGTREKQTLQLSILHNSSSGGEGATSKENGSAQSGDSESSATKNSESPASDNSENTASPVASKLTPFSEGSHYVKSNKASDPAINAGRTGLRAVVENDSPGGQYAWEVLKQTLAYAAELVGEIADTVFDIDEAMKLGYNWKFGPFEMIDALGPKWFAEKLKEESLPVPPILEKMEGNLFYIIQDGARQFFGTDGKYHPVERPDGILLLRDIKLQSEPVLKNGSAKVWDAGDGVLCFEHTSKMNTFDEGTFELLNKTIKTIETSDDYKALVVYNEASHFSAGANLGLALFMMNIAMYPQVEQFISVGQKTFMDLKYAPFPVVSAPSGMALGGGCEILLSSDAVQAHAETYTGLVEVGVGVIPGWGGCKELILRFQEREREKFKHDMDKIGKDNIWFSPDTTPMGASRKAFETIGVATVAKSAFEAVDIGYFRDTDGITMNRDRLLYDAKQRALELAKDYVPKEKIEDIRMPGPTGKTALELAVSDLHKSGKATDYDVVVSDHLAKVLTGGDADYTTPISEEDLLKLELEQFSALIRNEGTFARIETMLETGKPLRN